MAATKSLLAGLANTYCRTYAHNSASVRALAQPAAQELQDAFIPGKLDKSMYDLKGDPREKAFLKDFK